MDRIEFEIAHLGFRVAVLCLFLVGSLTALFPGS